jgi:hypothetical protein
VVGLVAVLAWSVGDGERSDVGRSGPADRAISPVAGDPPLKVSPAARVAARRFLAAFLAYEVEGGRTERAVIREGASASFADELTGRAPPGPPASAAPAHLQALRLHLLPGDPGLVLVSGNAVRPSGPEPLAFLFARRRGRWLAVAPAQ